MTANKKSTIVFVTFVVLALAITSCLGGKVEKSGIDSEALSSASRTPIQLEGTEVREYKGIRLDSAASSFRENSIKGPQDIDISAYALKLSGLVEKPLSLSYDEILNMTHYEKVVTLYCVEGWNATVLWEGVLVSDLLERAGVSPEATNLIFKAVDGYETSLDRATIYDKKIIMAFKINGVVLPKELGFSFILVAEDRWGYKWCRWINEITLSSENDYKGYWESRGYSISGSFNDATREDFSSPDMR